jgi:hypothetical protein
MVDNYPTFTNSPTIRGTRSIEPNIIESQYLGGFTARSQNGRRATLKTILVEQPIIDETEFQTFETFFEGHVAEAFNIKDLDYDKTGSTTMLVYFEGAASLSTSSARKFITFEVKEK